ncbi:MAG: tetratricopeptide repeat protein [Chloroherpetonaceae bacterium]
MMPNAPTKRGEHRRNNAALKERLATLNREAERFTLADAQKGIALSSEALALSRLLHDAQAEARSLFNLGYAMMRANNYPDAQRHIDEAHRLFAQLGDLNGEREALHCLGNICTMRYDFPAAKQFYTQALALSKTLKDKRGEARALVNLGALSEKEGHLTQAIHHMIVALNLMHEVGDKSAEAMTLRNIGVIYTKLSDFSVALSYYYKSLALREELGDEQGVALCLRSIGMMYDRLVNHQQALEAYQKCLAIFRRIADKPNEALTLYHIGTTFSDTRRFAEALAVFNASLEICNAFQIQDVKGMVLIERGKAYLELKQNARASRCLKEGLDCLQTVGDDFHIAQALGYFADLYVRQNKMESAIDALVEAVSKGERIQAKALVVGFHQKLTDIYSSRGEDAKALRHFERFYELDKEMFNEESDKRLKVLQIQFEVERKEKENDALRQELQVKEKALRTITRFLIEEAQTQTEMKNRLLDLRERLSSGAFESMEKRLSAMARELNPEKTWEVFEREFRDAHPEFLTYLSRRFPSLSPTELKVCAMLKLGHSTKEIARLLFISTSTALEHRSNIRRKLNLSEKENLTAFMARL